MRFVLFREFNSLMEALGTKRSRVRTAILKLSWQDLLAVWFLLKDFLNLYNKQRNDWQNAKIACLSYFFSCFLFVMVYLNS